MKIKTTEDIFFMFDTSETFNKDNEKKWVLVDSLLKWLKENELDDGFENFICKSELEKKLTKQE